MIYVEAKDRTATVDFSPSGSMRITCENFRATLLELIALKAIHFSQSRAAAAKLIDGLMGTLVGRMDNLKRRNRDDGEEADIHTARLYRRAAELGLLDPGVLGGFALLNWNYKQAPSTREYIQRPFEIKLPPQK